MRALLLALTLVPLLHPAGMAQDRQPDAPPPPKAQQQEPPEPPEEDLSLSEQKVYVLNPLQANKEIRIGNFYMKKGSYKAAARRYEEATKWNPGLGEGFLKLGEAQEKLGDHKAAEQAYRKFLELEPDSKQAGSVRRKLGKS